MWINAEERKPDTQRKVLVRSSLYYKGGAEVINIASWRGSEGWYITFLNESVGAGLVTHWMDIQDTLTLPASDEINRIDVPVMDALRESASILRSILYAWRRSNWNFPRTVTATRIIKVIEQAEALLGGENA